MPAFTFESTVSFFAFFFACLAWLYAIWCHRALNQLKRDYLVKSQKLNKQLSIYTSGSVGIGQRLINLEQRLLNIKKSQGELGQSNLDFSYTQAQKLIEQGVDAPTIAANSGLSPSEVNLMKLLHNRQSNNH